MIFSTRRK